MTPLPQEVLIVLLLLLLLLSRWHCNV